MAISLKRPTMYPHPHTTHISQCNTVVVKSKYKLSPRNHKNPIDYLLVTAATVFSKRPVCLDTSWNKIKQSNSSFQTIKKKSFSLRLKWTGKHSLFFDFHIVILVMLGQVCLTCILCVWKVERQTKKLTLWLGVIQCKTVYLLQSYFQCKQAVSSTWSTKVELAT